jgi:hypothetical protein
MKTTPVPFSAPPFPHPCPIVEKVFGTDTTEARKTQRSPSNAVSQVGTRAKKLQSGGQHWLPLLTLRVTMPRVVA